MNPPRPIEVTISAATIGGDVTDAEPSRRCPPAPHAAVMPRSSRQGECIAAALRTADGEVTERDRADVVRDAAGEQERRVGGLADVVRREELRAPAAA